MDAQGLEEIRRSAWGKAASAALRPFGLLGKVSEDSQFLLFRRRGEPQDTGKKFDGGFLRGFEAFLIDGQRFAEERFQGPVDEVDHASFARASRCIGGNDASGEGFD